VLRLSMFDQLWYLLYFPLICSWIFVYPYIQLIGYCLPLFTAYDKLAKWKIKIHGAIDGGTHFVLWAVVATDKKAETIFSAYKSAIDLYGHLIRIRLDYPSEHCLVRDDIQQARPNVRTPFLTGSSIHNQVFSRLLTSNRLKLSMHGIG
jgi:hypothetical protein